MATIDMMRSDLSKILLVACDQSYDQSAPESQTNKLLDGFPDSGNPSGHPTEMPLAWSSLLNGWTVKQRIFNQDTGFGATIFQRTNTDGKIDYIVAMQGTRGPNIQDWGGDLIYGWDKWGGPSGSGSALIDQLVALSSTPSAGKIHFTGQSLGGGLAEYALYDYAIRMRDSEEGFDPTKVTLTTYNGLGGIEALQTKRTGFNNNAGLFTNVDTAHFYVTNDLASRLGGGHLNGFENEYELKFVQTTAEGFVRRRSDLSLVTGSFVYAHRIESGFYGGFYQASRTGPFGDRRNDFPIDFTQAVTSEISILNIQNLARAGTFIAWLTNKDGALPTDTEAYARAVAALLIGMASGPPEEVHELVGALASNLYSSDTWLKTANQRDSFKLFVQEFLPVLAASPAGLTSAVAAQIVALASETGGPSNIVEAPTGLADELVEMVSAANSAGAAFAFEPTQATGELNDLLIRAEGKAKAGVLYVGAATLASIGTLLAIPSVGGAASVATISTILQVGKTRLDDAADATREILRASAQLLQQAFNDGAEEFSQAMASVSEALTDAADEASRFAVDAQVFVDQIANFVSDGLSFVARAISNRYDDLTLKFSDAFEWGATVTRSALDALVDNFTEAARNVSSRVQSAINDTLDVLQSAAQTIQIAAGHPQNPFNADGYDPDTALVPSAEVEEGGGRFFTVFLAYDAAEGGQRVTIKLEGDNVDKFRVLAGEELPVVNGEFTLTIQENTREATFVLINDEDVDADAAITVSATLIDEQGNATHQTHLEVNLTLDAQVEANTPTQNLILGDQDPESFDDTLNGTAGNDSILGLSMNDKLDGNAGSDILEGGSGVNILEGGAGEDQLFAEDAFDLATLPGYGGYGGDASTGVRGNWLNGQRGNDTLVGASGNDALTGGGGNDLIFGGAGDDFILGDHDWTAADFAWEHFPVSNPFDALTGVIVVNELYTADGAADIIYGGVGDDNIGAGIGDDIVYGEAGNDVLAGWEGDDVLLGGAGDDKLTGEFYGDLPPDVFGSDYLNGEEGNDELYGEGGNDVLFGGAGDDRLFGYTDWSIDTTPQYDGADHIEGEGGRDYIHGQTGDDFLEGGADDDTVYGDAGADLIYGGSGNDTLLGDNSAIPVAENGNDSIDGGDGDDLIIGGGESDTLLGSLGIDQLQGGSGDDELDGGEDADVLFGDAGDAGPGTQGSDMVEGGSGNDEIVGGGGVDILSGGDGDDLLFGDGDDITVADQAADLISGGAGSDNIRGYGGDDEIFGDADNDTLWGEAGADYVDGGAGDDLLFGDADAIAVADQGGDTLIGGDGNDQLVGYDGADTLDGGAGTDTLFGDAGNDTYNFERGYAQDLIFDQDAMAGNLDKVMFAADIIPDDITATRGPVFTNDLVLTINGTSDAITIANQFSADSSWRVEEIRFADGTVWTPTTTPMLIQGTAANNVINGTSGPDVIEGLAGNDTLQGGTGGDRYRFFRGDGADLITDSDATAGNVDKVLYAADILPSEIQGSRSGSNLLLRLTGTADQVTISNYFQNDGATSFSVEEIKFFADGTVWDVNTVKQMVLTGTSGADTITGYATDDTLTGLGGNDTLTGNAGKDTLNGGTGNDVLQGGTGNDTYVIARGDGQDTITDVDGTAGNVDKIVYAADILPSDVKATRSGNNLLLSLTGTADQVTVTNYLENDGATSSLVEQIEFLADGTIWDLNTVKAMVLTGTAGADTITGYASDDLLVGLAGSDTLIGNAGDDTLDGGLGNDNLQGGTGNDIYRIFRGDGQDTITDSDSTSANIDKVLYAADILPSQVKAVRSGSNLVLQLTGTTDQVTVTNYFLNDGGTPYSVEQIQFLADDTVWDVNTLKSMIITPTGGNDTIIGYATNDNLSGLGGNDVIRGGGGNDTLDGGAGNDSLFGEDGSDTYQFAIGSGQDTVTNADSDTGGTTDLLQFAAGIAPSQVTTTKSVNDLVLTINGTADQAVIRDYFLGGTAIVEQIKFADGTIWTEQTIASFFPISGTSGNDNLQGTGLSETINGLAGNDTLRGGGGNDTIDGGLGSDQIYGEDGNDTLIAGTGDPKNASVSNSLHGGNGDDVLVASNKILDHLYGDAGNDILLGGTNQDWLEDIAGNNLMFGGATVDFLNLGDQNNLVIAGTGDDSIDGDNSNINGIFGRAVLAFNKTDGKDVARRLGSGSAISIGGGALYSNLSLTTDGVHLTFKVGNNSTIFENWYGQLAFGIPANPAVSTLQIVIEGTRDYSASSTNPMKNKTIQAFNFLGLVSAFDAARAAGQTFNVANNLANYRLWGSDTDAIGGAVAYQYARTGSISTLSYDQMRAVITNPAFAVGAQPITVSAAAASASASSADPIVTEEAAAAFSVTTDARLVTDSGTAASGSADVIATADVETVSGVGTASAPGAVERDGTRVTPELLTPGKATSVAVDSSIPPVGAVASGKGFATTPDATTPRAPRAAAPAGALDQSAGLVPHEASAAASVTSVGVNAQTHTQRSGAAPDDSLEALAADWFNRRSPQEDLSLLDDIARGEGIVNAPAHGSVVAAWEASHRWLSQYADARKDTGEAAADGADLSGLSLLGTGSASYDMPQPVVGLRNVSGHQLASFRGLREGVSVLTQP